MYQKKPIRRGQLISPWGIGSIVNFPGDESLMVCGMDAWEYVFNNAHNKSEFTIREERLERRLGVNHFRYPPDFRDEGKNSNLKIPFIRFPQWHYCPKCGAMEKLRIYSSRQKCKGHAFTGGRSCHNITERKRPYIIPVRFVAVCGQGHIEDFPFTEWVHRDKAVDSDCVLRLSTHSTSSLAGIKISCRCGESKTMAGAFNQGSLIHIKNCRGERPWLGETDENANGCGHELLVIQRGASNLYFPEVRSSIYLPKWDKDVQRRIIEILDRDWHSLTRSAEADGKLNKYVFEAFAEKYNVNVNDLLHAAEEKIQSESVTDESQNSDSEELYRKTEYDAILSGAGGDNQDFFVTNVSGAEFKSPVQDYISSVSLIHKLRETRAFTGFSRWLPEDGRSLQDKKADLALSTRINWLPAIIVKGEGVFFEFDRSKLDIWSQRDAVQKRANILIRNYNHERSERNQSESRITAKYILIHSFAHIIINQFSYDCGYGSSALRERIYCDSDYPDNPMNGVLIYTASGDTEGSLGGLVRQGKPDNLETIVATALQKSQWCSSDPICITSKGQGPGSCNLAACHGCALLPETCCEVGNRLLDRAMLIGTFENSDIGFFSGFEENQLSK